MPTLPNRSHLDHMDRRAELVFEHRRKGGQINRKFAAELAKQGFGTAHGLPLDTVTLYQDYQRYVKHLTIFHRETYEHVGTLQLMRLETNMELLNRFVDAVTPEEGADELPAPGQIFMAINLAKEIRQTVAEISKLTGSNAPTEVIVTQRLEDEVQSILGILRQGLSDETFQEVAQCLAKGMGLVKEKARTQEEGVVSGYRVIDEGDGDGVVAIAPGEDS